MVKPLEEYLNEFIIKRSDEACNFILNNNEKYKDLYQKTKCKIEQLLYGLPENMRKLFYEYEEKENQRIELMLEIIYYQGLEDGLYIQDKQKRFSSKVYENSHL